MILRPDYITSSVGNAINTITGKKATVKTQTKYKEVKHTVYTLKDSAGVVQYVGRTTNPVKREMAHKSNPARANLKFHKEKENLNKLEARGLEQYLIMYYSTLNRNNPMNNQINGIARNNRKYNIYMNAAQIYFFDSETYVGP